jgi:Tfp pilus assembly protein PilX
MKKKQHGVSLLTVTILLLAMGLLAMTAFFNSQTELKLVSNIQASELAYSEAEAAIFSAESWLGTDPNSQSLNFVNYSNSTPYLYPIGYMATNKIMPQSMTWDDTNSLASGPGSARYLIEMMATSVQVPGSSITRGQASTACRTVNIFRIISRAGHNYDKGGRMLESIYIPAPYCGS